jgi:hypothetical protein
MNCSLFRALTLARLMAALLYAWSLAVSGCDSAEKYLRKSGSDGTPEVLSEGKLRLSIADAQWAQGLKSRMDAAQLRVDLADTDGGVALADSLVLLAESVVDTTTTVELRRFLLLFLSDGYGRLVAWENARENEEAAGLYTQRFETLATRLRQRNDSIPPVP